ncbi:FkbM family methyltransferase [Alphaproteobacteria bacterium]|nr:FkbM family methyltransferase [Alphaproteobacteria bacterium]
MDRLGKDQLDGWCVEFGAWDGIHLSNTCNLIKNRGYSAVLIEGDSNKHLTLCDNFPEDNIVKICAFVTFEGSSTLDAILSRTEIPRNFDFLSIDIDGCDYFILDSLIEFRPKIVCIEFNPTIPNEVEFIQSKNFSVKHGSSAKALVGLAHAKGYALVATTATNLIFVDAHLSEIVVGSSQPTLEELRDDIEYKAFIFSGFDGTVLTNKPVALPWHGLKIAQETLQALPKGFRQYSLDYGPVRKKCFSIWKKITRRLGRFERK